MKATRTGVAFGFAQGLMPLIGWGFGLAFASVIRDVDHWVAFVLLALIGGKMFYEAHESKNKNLNPTRVPGTKGWALLSASVATSIDAAAAGVTLPLLGSPALFACAVIGLVTLVVSIAGVLIGAAAGARIGRRAEVVGGLVLIGIGTKILIEHLLFGT